MPSLRTRAPLVFLVAVALLPCVDYARWIWRRFPAEMFTPNNALVVRDYLNIWAGGGLGLMGRVDLVLDPEAYRSWLGGVFGPELDAHFWVYPPHALLLAAPFALLPLLPGFAAWTVANLAFLALVLRRAGVGAPVALAAVLSPAALDNALAGQNGALMGAALAGGLSLAGRRPAAAGALLGLLTIKPQLGLLVPVCLLASRDWRGLAWTAAFAVLYVAASLPFFGLEAWVRYATVTVPFNSVIMAGGADLAFQLQMPSPFVSARAAGFDLRTASVVQAAATLACLALTAWAWNHRRPPEARPVAVALTLMLVPLATPYSHSYDLVATAVAVAILVRDAPGGALGRPEFYAFGAAWIWPGIAFKWGTSVCAGFGPLFLAPAAVCAAVRLARNPAPARTDPPPDLAPATGAD